MVQQIKNPTSIHEGVGLISGLTQWVKDLVLLQAAIPGNSAYREGAPTKKKKEEKEMVIHKETSSIWFKGGKLQSSSCTSQFAYG